MTQWWGRGRNPTDGLRTLNGLRTENEKRSHPGKKQIIIICGLHFIKVKTLNHVVTTWPGASQRLLCISYRNLVYNHIQKSIFQIYETVHMAESMHICFVHLKQCGIFKKNMQMSVNRVGFLCTTWSWKQATSPKGKKRNFTKHWRCSLMKSRNEKLSFLARCPLVLIINGNELYK